MGHWLYKVIAGGVQNMTKFIAEWWLRLSPAPQPTHHLRWQWLLAKVGSPCTSSLKRRCRKEQSHIPLKEVWRLQLAAFRTMTKQSPWLSHWAGSSQRKLMRTPLVVDVDLNCKKWLQQRLSYNECSSYPFTKSYPYWHGFPYLCFWLCFPCVWDWGLTEVSIWVVMWETQTGCA